jgi:plasmid stability protein
MSTIHVRDVSEGAVTTLKVRAARAGQSLQAYVRQLLESEAAATPPEEAAERARDIAARSEVTADDVIDVIAAMREARE